MVEQAIEPDRRVKSLWLLKRSFEVKVISS